MIKVNIVSPNVPCLGSRNNGDADGGNSSCYSHSLNAQKQRLCDKFSMQYLTSYLP